jgi:uncharacterized protein HemY
MSPVMMVRTAVGDTETTVEQIKKKMPKVMTNKEIYNALGYLTRKNQVRRLSYGVYRNLTN